MDSGGTQNESTTRESAGTSGQVGTQVSDEQGILGVAVEGTNEHVVRGADRGLNHAVPEGATTGAASQSGELAGNKVASKRGRKAVQPKQEEVAPTPVVVPAILAPDIKPIFKPVEMPTVPVQFKMPWDTSAFEKSPSWPEPVKNAPTSNPWSGNPAQGIHPMFNEADMAKLQMKNP